MFLTQRYTEADLATSPMVARWAAVVSAVHLCMRRGNPVPDSLQAQFDRITDPDSGLAARVSNGQMQIPGVPLRCDSRPMFSNHLVDRRYAFSKVRRSSANSSTAPTTLTRKTAEEPAPIHW